MQEGPELTIVMPCLNESETLAGCIAMAQGYLGRSGTRGEIVIGDNGSTDGSQKIAADLGARVVDVEERGYGAALYAACLAARGRYIVMGDSDGSYDFSDLDRFLERLRAGCDLVMGNRFKGEIKPGAMPWKNRYIGNPILSRIGTMLFPSRLGDFHCGLRGFSRDAFLRMDLQTTGMEFASEMVIKATQRKMRLAEVPITLSKDGRSRPPHLRPYRDGWRHLRFMLLFSPNWIFLYPGMILMAASLSFGGLLVRGPVNALGHQFSVDTLIYCAFFTLIGFQAVMFALLSRIYAVQESLYPMTDGYKHFFRQVTLESGLLIGFLLVLIGFLSAGYTLFLWSHRGFGLMDLEHTARIVIPAATSLALGFEVILFSFFLSTLGLGVRRHPSTDKERGTPGDRATAGGRATADDRATAGGRATPGGRATGGGEA